MLERPSGIPRQSGCYLFRDERGDVIYVGKARVLAQRLSSYFQRRDRLTAKTQFLMDDASSLEWIVTPSELDALILENELIKDNQPRYNLRLKDDKSFPFVALDSRQAFAAPYTTRGAHHRGVRYFGPFVDVRALRVTMDELLQAFPLRSCSTHKFNYHQRIERVCLLYDIGKCAGPCVGAIDVPGYQTLVASWTRFFDGDVRPLRELLRTQMVEASAHKHYEAAAKARDGLAALERAANTQSVVLDDHSNLDVIAVASEGSRSAVVRFRVRFGRVVGRTVHLIDRAMDESDSEILENAITYLYDDAESIPATVVVEGTSLVSPLSSQYLNERRGTAVRVHAARRGKRRRVVELATHDATAVIQRDSLRRQSDHNVRARALQELGAALLLSEPPYRIECFDMSHLQGTNYVGSMVVFEDALAMKRDYRHFNVKEVLGNDDVAAMGEVVRRRLAHWNERPTGSKFRRPDLIIIDGGLPQLHAAQMAAGTLGLDDRVELVALAKREELLYRPGSSTPIALERGSESLYLVQRIRDEAHRFAITFHRSKRAKSMMTSSLEGVKGLGPARRERLVREFGSLGALRQASLEELRGVTWLPEDVAHRLYDHLGKRPTARLTRESAHNE